MNQIKPHSLWLGHSGEGGDFQQVFNADIKALVHLAAEDAALHPPRDLIYCRVPLVDGGGNRAEALFLAISTVATLLKLRVSTLVFCGAGMSRAPAIAAAALGMVHQEPPEEYLQRVSEHHASDVSAGLWSEVTRLLPAVR